MHRQGFALEKSYYKINWKEPELVNLQSGLPDAHDCKLECKGVNYFFMAMGLTLYHII